MPRRPKAHGIKCQKLWDKEVVMVSDLGMDEGQGRKEIMINKTMAPPTRGTPPSLPSVHMCKVCPTVLRAALQSACSYILDLLPARFPLAKDLPSVAQTH